MSSENFSNKSIISPYNFKISDYDFGLSYFVIAAPGQIIPSQFDKQEKICFINCPFKEAIKVPTYIRKKGETFIAKIADELNALTSILSEDNDSQHFDYLAIILFNELKFNDIILVETTGLSKESIIRFLRLCLILTKKNHKKVFVVDVSNSQPDLKKDMTIYAIDNNLINEIGPKGTNYYPSR